MSDGRGRFTVAGRRRDDAARLAAQFVDYDNDGLARPARADATAGRGCCETSATRWVDVTATALPAALDAARSIAHWRSPPAISTATATPTCSSRTASRARARLAQRRRQPARVAARAAEPARQQPQRHRRQGGAARRQPAAEDRDLVGLARRWPGRHPFRTRRARRADVVRVLWPAGILQAEVELPAPRPATTPR